jgi:hypothetical protein
MRARIGRKGGRRGTATQTRCLVRFVLRGYQSEHGIAVLFSTFFCGRCLEYGFEYVHLDDAQQMLAEKAELRDRKGLQRVRECIEATTWRHVSTRSRDVIGPRNKAQTEKESGRKHLNEGALKTLSSAGTRQGIKRALLCGLVDAKVAGYKGGSDEEDETAVDELFDMLHAVKSSAGQYSDTDRRARAADVALRFAQSLGIFDDE